MARKLHVQKDLLLTKVPFTPKRPLPVESEWLFHDIVTKRDQALLLSPQLRAFFAPEVSGSLRR
jgi:hypothetical protein